MIVSGSPFVPIQSQEPHVDSRSVPTFSVVIPAHDEESVIGRCLAAWSGELEPGEAEVVVVANGCSDGTAEAARDFGVRVLELPAASKSAALNAGDGAVA